MSPRWGARSATWGVIACMLALALLIPPSPLAAACGVELLALAFWLWARAADDAREQVPRWDWLRRPAMALWLALALRIVRPLIAHDPMAMSAPRFAWLTRLAAACVAWAGLELVAALPLARRYSDFPGPYAPLKPWIPVVLPCAGFLVLWSGADTWRDVASVSRVALALLVLTALLGALRAFARRGWTASLRWLAVAHTALALVPLAGRVVHPQAIFLLWVGAFGGPTFILAGELAGASPRRGRLNTRLWRLAGWVSTTALAWPALAVFTTGHGFMNVPGYLAVALAVGISTWIMVGRLEVAPERRRVMRPMSGLTAGRIAAVIVTALGPAGLALAWWYGFEPHGSSSVLALAPSVIGGLLASAPRQRPLARIGVRLTRAMDVLRLAAAWTSRAFSRGERAVLGGAAALGRTAMAPLRDLHTGDAQEYLLLLAGVSVLALLLPLLR